MKRSVLAACFAALAAATFLGEQASAGSGAVIYRANPQIFEDSGIVAPGSEVPVKLALAPKAGVLVNETFVLSEPSEATGPDAGFLLVARGGELRLCPSADCATGGSFSPSVRASNGARVQARIAGPATAGGVQRMTVESGSYTGTFEVTATPDARLDPVADVVNAAPGSLQLSTLTTLVGFASTTLSVAGGEISVNGGNWTTSSAAKAGDQVQVRVTAGAAGTRKTAEVSVAGGPSLAFTVSAKAQDTLPDAFTVAAVVDAEPSTLATSAVVTPTGYEGTVTVSAANGEISIDGAGWAASGTIATGQGFRIRHLSSSGYAVKTSASVTVGTGPAVAFDVTTRVKDAVPDTVAFASSPDQAAGATVTSNVVQLSGHDGIDATVSGTGALMRVCSAATCSGGTVGAWVASAPVARNEYDQLQIVAGAAGEKRTAALSYGAAAPATWDVTAKASGPAVVSGALYAWGDNANGQLGTGTTSNSLSPVKVAYPAGVTSFSRLSTFYSTACAFGSDDALYCWGMNNLGQVGDGTTTQRTTPTKVSLPSGVTKFLDVSVGFDNACATGSDGTAYCWGNNGSGQLGDGTKTARTTPVKVSLPTGVASISNVSVGRLASCGIGSDDAAYCWGDNTNGQLGNGTTTFSSVPVKVALPSGVTKLSGLSLGQYTAYAKGSDGSAYSWGTNNVGQLGDGSTNTRNSPTKVVLPSGVSNLSNVMAGIWVACGTGSDAAVYCWGYNSNGGVGDGTTTQRSTPTKVSMPAGVTSISLSDAALYRACGVGSNNVAYCWGYNVSGALGDGTTSDRSTPVAVAVPNGIAGFHGPVSGWTSSYAIAR